MVDLNGVSHDGEKVMLKIGIVILLDFDSLCSRLAMNISVEDQQQIK